MKQAAQLLTADDLYRMSHDGVRRELVRGGVREMAPAGAEHGAVTENLSARLWSFVFERKLGRVFAAETGFLLARNPDTVRAPDCAFVRADRLPSPLPRKYLPLASDLAVETVSADDRAGEVKEKVEEWLKAGTRRVCVLDPRERIVVVHRAGTAVKVLRSGDALIGEDIVPGFSVAVESLWL